MSYLDDILEQGYAGPYPLLKKGEGERLFPLDNISLELQYSENRQRHVTNQTIASVALRDEILEKMKPLLGDNILLSGSQLIGHADKAHDWHVDVEHTGWEGLTVWIGLSSAECKKCIKVISSSHKFKLTPQDLRHRGVDIYNDSEVLASAQEISADAKLVEIDLFEGEFIILDSLTWHASGNISNFRRHALVLRYRNTNLQQRPPSGFQSNSVNIDEHIKKLILINSERFDVMNFTSTKRVAEHHRGLLKHLAKYLFRYLQAKNFIALLKSQAARLL
ncbi:phytanoyl-CoA dioxygenase family protein [Mucilaginibacter sp. PAMB04168]|uniref:phytanoyl-CoA dioxygenase family protein n=1 Tax=Mucilaginibacter sp. PAMB04168 TaxID=3138567 RepID=UPI0031F6CD79